MSAGFVVSKLEGHGGEVWIGKSTPAATLGSWVALPGARPGSWEFSGRLVTRDEYFITQGPDVLRLPFGNRELRWQGTLEIAGENVRGTFDGPPEER